MTEMEKELLALLDLIEITEDSTLATQRFDIAEKYGYVVIIGEKTTSKLQ